MAGRLIGKHEKEKQLVYFVFFFRYQTFCGMENYPVKRFGQFNSFNNVLYPRKQNHRRT